MIVADVFLRYLKEVGVDYLFANAGTDFAPLIEAFARADKAGVAVPEPIPVPHENLAVAMAHGYTMATGRPQAVMAHVNVGTANMINGVMNAARARIPMYVLAGRTPITEGGELKGSRNFIIHWAQEMFDQAGMLRELVKWDYELRNGTQVFDVVDRMVEVATAPPGGPVYLTLPREVLTAGYDGSMPDAERPRVVPGPPAPRPADVEQLAGWIAEAERPLMLTTSAGRIAGNVGAIADFAERFAIGVIQFAPTDVCLPKDHPMGLGFWPGREVEEADLVIVLDSDVPWIPSIARPGEAARIAHLGVDPLHARYPVRSFRSDLSIAADIGLTIDALSLELADRVPNETAIDGRRTRIEAAHDDLVSRWDSTLEENADSAPLHPAWVTHRIAAAAGDDAIFVNEYPALREHLPWNRPGSFLGHSSAGGLGWGLGAALGAKLANPDKLVVATVGDGSYMFGNPTPAHLVSAARDLPVLFVVFNNHRWHAVTRATLGIFPSGTASESDPLPLTSLEPSPDYAMVARASGAYGETVTDPKDLDDALERAIRAVRDEGRQALLDIECVAIG